MSLPALLKQQSKAIQQVLEANRELTLRLTDCKPQRWEQDLAPSPVEKPFPTEDDETMSGFAGPVSQSKLMFGFDATTSCWPFRMTRGLVPFGSRSSSLQRELEARYRNAESYALSDARSLHEQVQDAVMDLEYNVEDLYSSRGPWQAIARSNVFKNVTLLVVAFSVVWLGVETDITKAKGAGYASLDIVDNLLCAYFVVELLTRFLAFRRCRDAFKDSWFLFDLAILIVMVSETWAAVVVIAIIKRSNGADITSSTSGLTVFRALRLLRLVSFARVVHLLNYFPELVILVRCMRMCLRAVWCLFCLLIGLSYIFAVFFTQILPTSKFTPSCFETVSTSMNCLLLGTAFPQQRDLLNSLLSVNFGYYLLLLVYFFIGTLTLMTMLIGIVSEVVSVCADTERERLVAIQLKAILRKLFIGHSRNPEDYTISKDDFMAMLQCDRSIELLHTIGIDVIALANYSELPFRRIDHLSFHQFVQMVIQFRSAHATAKASDLIDVRHFISQETDHLRSKLKAVTPQVETSSKQTQATSPRFPDVSSVASKKRETIAKQRGTVLL